MKKVFCIIAFSERNYKKASGIFFTDRENPLRKHGFSYISMGYADESMSL